MKSQKRKRDVLSIKVAFRNSKFSRKYLFKIRNKC